MSNGIDRLTIDQHWDRLVVLAAKAGAPASQWELVEGEEQRGERLPWQVMRNGSVVVTLGYTKREVAATLLAMNSILAVVFGG